MKTHSLKLLAATLVGASALLATPAFAKGERAAVEASCGANSDPVACRKEAMAARAAAKSGQLTAGDKANALARCEVVPPEFRDTCKMRVESGTRSGSVEGGGAIIEYREEVIVK